MGQIFDTSCARGVFDRASARSPENMKGRKEGRKEEVVGSLKSPKPVILNLLSYNHSFSLSDDERIC